MWYPSITAVITVSALCTKLILGSHAAVVAKVVLVSDRVQGAVSLCALALSRGSGTGLSRVARNNLPALTPDAPAHKNCHTATRCRSVLGR